MHDRCSGSTGARQQRATDGERSVDSGQRQLAVDVFALGVDDE